MPYTDSSSWCVAGIITSLAMVAPSSIAQEIRLDSRAAVVAWLKHNENLIRTAECELEFTPSPTRPEMVPLIADVVRVNKIGSNVNFVIGERYVRKHSYTLKWHRKGDKERSERFLADGAHDIRAHDGQILRTVSMKEGDVAASVNTTKNSHWSDTNRVHPFSLLYLYYERPYSDWVQIGMNFNLRKEQRKGNWVTRVAVTNPKELTHQIVLYFNTDGRLTERHIISKLPADPKPFVREVHLLSDYESFQNPNGEPIWFPRRAFYHYNMGIHPNGTLVEYLTETIAIKSIKFNVDIPDEVFALRIPSSARVWDGVTGLGWLPPGNRPELVFPEEAGRKRWIVVGLVIALAFVITVAVVWRRRRAQPMP